jgi:hypothetical protein
MPRIKGSKNKPKPELPPKRSHKKAIIIEDNEIELLGIICQAIQGMSEDGKKRTMQFINSKYSQYA